MRRTLLLLSFVAGMGLTACGGAVYYANVPPPPVRVEAFGPAPAPGYVWINGYWGWRGNNYVWFPGRYVRPPHRNARWVEPRWEHRGGRYEFRRGYWER
jgi:hypothetical protein